MTDQNKDAKAEKDVADMTDEELKELLKTPRSAYVKMALVIILIAGGVIAMFAGVAYFMTSAEKVIKDTVRQLYPAPSPASNQAPTPQATPTPPEAQVPAQPPAPTVDKVVRVRMAPSVDLPRAVRKAASRVKPIRVLFAGNQYGFGNMVMLEDNLAVTSAHMLSLHTSARPAAMEVICEDGDQPTKAQALVGSRVADILFLRVSCQAEPITYRTKVPHRTKAWLSGLNYDFDQLTAEMWVRKSTVDRRLDILKTIRPCFQPEVIQALGDHLKQFGVARYQLPVAIRSQAYPGNSGSLVHDAQGRMLGVLFGASCNAVSFFIPTADLLEVAKRANLKLGGKRV